MCELALVSGWKGGLYLKSLDVPLPVQVTLELIVIRKVYVFRERYLEDREARKFKE